MPSTAPVCSRFACTWPLVALSAHPEHVIRAEDSQFESLPGRERQGRLTADLLCAPRARLGTRGSHWDSSAVARHDTADTGQPGAPGTEQVRGDRRRTDRSSVGEWDS